MEDDAIDFEVPLMTLTTENSQSNLSIPKGITLLQ